MQFDELEDAWLRRRTGRRKEIRVALAVGLVVLAALSLVVWMLWPRISALW